MRLRLPEKAPVNYQVRRDNGHWPDHLLRVQITASLIAWLKPDSVFDPACGDASVVAAAHALRPIRSAHLSNLY